MKTIQFFILTSLLSFSVVAQQEGQFIQLANNPYLLNPAAGGMTRVMQFEVGMRNQWTGYSNAPQTYVASGHSRIRFGKSTPVLAEYAPDKSSLFQSPEITGGELKHVVGGSIVSETIGPFSRLTAQGSYAVHMPLFRDVMIGVGLSAGINNIGIMQDRVVLYQNDDPAYMQFLSGAGSQTVFNANGGLIVYHPKFTVGISSLQLLQNDVVFSGVSTASQFNRHYYFLANYGFQVSEQLELRPTVMARVAENSPWTADFGAKLTFNKAAWLYASYRTGGTIGVQVGANLFKQLYAAYGYEFGIGALRTSSNGTHEISLGYYLGKNRNIKKELNGSSPSEVE